MPALADKGTQITRIWPTTTTPSEKSIAPPPSLVSARLPPIPPSLPDWLKTEIKETNAVALWQFQHKGQTAYFVRPGGNDQQNPVFSGSGTYICSPSGGFEGGGDGKCPSTALVDPGTRIIHLWPESSITGEELAPPPWEILKARQHDLPRE